MAHAVELAAAAVPVVEDHLLRIEHCSLLSYAVAVQTLKWHSTIKFCFPFLCLKARKSFELYSGQLF